MGETLMDICSSQWTTVLSREGIRSAFAHYGDSQHLAQCLLHISPSKWDEKNEHVNEQISSAEKATPGFISSVEFLLEAILHVQLPFFSLLW